MDFFRKVTGEGIFSDDRYSILTDAFFEKRLANEMNDESFCSEKNRCENGRIDEKETRKWKASDDEEVGDDDHDPGKDHEEHFGEVTREWA